MAENTNLTHVQNTASDPRAKITTGSALFGPEAIVAADFTAVRTGFRPKHVVWNNVTSGASFQNYDGFAAGTVLKTTAAGVRSFVPNSLTFKNDGFEVSQDPALEAIGANTLCAWGVVG